MEYQRPIELGAVQASNIRLNPCIAEAFKSFRKYLIPGTVPISCYQFDQVLEIRCRIWLHWNKGD